MGEAFFWGAVGASTLLVGALVAYIASPSRRFIAIVMALGAGLLIVDAILIALLAALGAELTIIAVVAGLMIGRRRWLKRQPGEFAGAVRVCRGQVDGLKAEWTRGSGRWVRDVFVRSKGPFLLRNELVPADSVSRVRRASNGEVKRLGDRRRW